MPLLVIYCKTSGQIVSSTHVNTNHTAGNFPPKVQRLLAHSEELNLNHILVEDHVNEISHHVQHTTTGVSIVKKEEANPLWLEPLLKLIGDVPDAEKFKEGRRTQIRYITAAAANPEYIKLVSGITIFVPCQARWHCAADFFDSLMKLEHPEGVSVNLILYDNSRDPSFKGFCRWLLAGAKQFDTVSYIYDDTPPAHDDRQATVKAVARIYDRMTYLVDTEFILTLEDDVIPLHPNILVQLYRSLSSNKQAAASAANVVERKDNKTMCWYLEGEIPTIKYAQKQEIIQPLDAVSFSCTLWRTRLLKMVAIRPQRKDEKSFFATDITLCADLQDLNYHCLMNWNLLCAHVEPWFELRPLRETPFFSKTFRKPNTRRMATKTALQEVGLPTTKKSIISVFTELFVEKTSQVFELLVVIGVRADLPVQFVINFLRVQFPPNTVVVVYGATNPEDWAQCSRVQFIDDWKVLANLIKSSKQLLWWSASVIIHPEDVLKLVTTEGLTITDLPSGDLPFMLNVIPDVWASPCSIQQLHKSSLGSYTTLVDTIFSDESEVVEVRGSRWLSQLGKWIPADGYRPRELPLGDRPSLRYHGEQITIDEKEWPLDLSIGVTCIDHPQMTIEAIESLLETTRHLECEIMVWDNASTSPKMDLLFEKYRDHSIVKIFRSPVNRGYIYPMNFMSKRSRGQFYVVSNNDIIAHEGWFEALKKPFEEDSMVAQTAPVPEYGYLNDQMHGGPGEGELDYLEGFFFMLPRWVLNRYQVFDDRHLNFATCEDADLTLRLREFGFKVVACPEAQIDHLRSTTRQNDSSIEKIMDSTEEQNKEYMRGRWKDYLETRTFGQHTILVKRQGANGDLLTCESALKSLRWKFPHSRITLVTECVSIMEHCPWVDEVRPNPEEGIKYSVEYNLDGVYEKELGQNRGRVVCAACDVPYVRPGYWVTDRAEALVSSYKDKDPLCVIHWRASWENRRWPLEKWKELASLLTEDMYVVEVGGSRDERLHIGEPFYDRAWEDVAALISTARVVVCSDSSILHVALGVQKPTVCLFGSTKPEYVCDSPYVHPVMVESLDCLGCHHNPPFPKIYSECHQPEIYCQLELSVESVYKKIFEVCKL